MGPLFLVPFQPGYGGRSLRTVILVTALFSQSCQNPGAGSMNTAGKVRDKIAALSKELDAIHFANARFWKVGAASTRQEKAEYQLRLNRVEEIRRELAQLRSD